MYVRAQSALVMGEYLWVHQFVAQDNPHLEVHRADSESRVRDALHEMRGKFDSLDGAIHEAGCGDVSSGSPIRNGWFDRRPALQERLTSIRNATSPVFNTVRQAAITAGSSEQQ